MIWFLIAGFLILDVFIKYVIYLYLEYRYLSTDTADKWYGKSFIEYVHDGGKLDMDNFIFWIAMLIPIAGYLLIVLDLFLTYGGVLFDAKNIPSPFRFVLKLFSRKKYLLERVSKEI
jgi:hypothetical protein